MLDFVAILLEFDLLIKVFSLSAHDRKGFLGV
jgi:hypothetical protein